MTATVAFDQMRKIPLFRQMNETELHQLSEITVLKDFIAGDLLLRQGDHSQILWVMLEGICEVSRWVHADQPDAGEVTLATLEPFSHFGEMSFFNAAQHSANVRAKTAVKVLCVPHSDYQDLVVEGASAAYKLAYNVVDSLAERLRRMDQWVAELSAHQPDVAAPKAEWGDFREKLLKQWNL